MAKYLDTTGLAYFWQKIKAYIDTHSGGGSLPTPVSIANGGTGASNASQALTNLGVTTAINTATNALHNLLDPQIQGVVLFDQPNYQPAYGVDLLDNFTNYDFIKIVCKDNDGTYVAPIIIPNPQNGNKFNVTSVYPGGGSAIFYIKSTTFMLQDNNKIRWGSDGNNWMCGEIGLITSNSSLTWNYVFRHTPVLVIGYKYE